jgi:hypothetical protein
MQVEMGKFGQPCLREVLVPGPRRASASIVTGGARDRHALRSKQTGAIGGPLAPVDCQKGSGGDAGEPLLMPRANRESRLFGQEPQHLPDVIAILEGNRIILQQVENLTEHRLV